MTYMYPGMTDFQMYYVPFAADSLARASVSYSQEGETMLIKDAYEFTPWLAEGETEEGCTFGITLNQADTLRFKDDKDIYIQVNVVTVEGSRAPSSPIILTTGKQFDRRILEQEEVE